MSQLTSAARQRLRYLRTSDGVQIACAESGSGPLLVKAANWLTHLEYEWESPVWGHWIRFFSEHFRFVRYDERGCGMSDWTVGGLSLETWIDDLELVIDTMAPDQPVSLLGISHGSAACIGYAVRHPERVSRMVLYGGYARGYAHRGDPAAEREYEAITELVELSWGKENPAFREVFTSRFIPGGTAEELEWFNELCRRTTSPQVAARLLKMRSSVQIAGLLDQVRVPVLVIHGREDNVVPLAEGRLLAASIPGAEYVELESRNHVLLKGEPAWPRFQEEVLRFLQIQGSSREGHAFAKLSPREREVLVLITDGLGNAAIGERLAISEKTVRNHLSRVFDKLGVWTRAQAIVFARDHGFRR